MNIVTQTAPYREKDTNLTGLFVFDDEQNGKRPGVLVVHAGGGLDDHAKNRAKRIAEQGFVAFACDLYGDGVAGNRELVLAKIKELRKEPSRLRDRALAGLAVLKSHYLVDARIAAVGYCFGGMTVLELARGGVDIAGVVSIHGTLATTQPAQSGNLKAKILVCHGALDPHVPIAQVTAFADEMNAAGADWQLIVYGGAMHGFTHDTGPDMPGVAYHALSDARSSRALQNFFGEMFG